MIAAIHQPEHLPWRGFWRKMMAVDVFIILDDVQFAKGNRQNRNLIVGADGATRWITVPVRNESRLTSNLNQTQISSASQWRVRYSNLLHEAYRSSPYYQPLVQEILHHVNMSSNSLVDLNLELLNVLRTWLHITTPIVRSSSLDVPGSKNERLVALLKSVGANKYLSGEGGLSYLDLSLFATADIEVFINRYAPPEYVALNGYVPGVSIVDCLFAYGTEARNYI